MMIHVAMDTSGIGQNRSINHASFKALKRLAEDNEICIHIPYVVKREVETQEYDRYLKEYQSALSAIKKLNNLRKNENIHEISSSLYTKIKSIEEAIKTDAFEQAQSWFKNLNAKIYTIDAKQAEIALEAYFLGTPPLTNAKNREDIPDSFICRGIEKIKENIDHLYLIVKDKKIIKNFDNKSGYTLYQDIDSFIKSNVIQHRIKELDIIKNSIKIINLIRKNNEINNELEVYISKNIGEEVHGMTISDSSIPDESNEATITMYGDNENINLIFTNSTYYGNGQFSIDFTTELAVNAVYYVYKADYYAMDEDDINFSISDHNSHFFEAEDDFNIKINGTISFKLDYKKFDISRIEQVDNKNLEDYLSSIFISKEIQIESINKLDILKK